MIQVLNRAFDILDCLAENPETVRPLSQIADRVNLHPATCAGILKTLVLRSYVQQIAPKKGYILGPMAYYLARKGPFRKDLLQVAEPSITKLAAMLQEHVLLAVLHQQKRFVLCEADGNPTVRIDHELRMGNGLYETATGRLLVAHLAPDELNTLLARQKIRGSVWPEASTQGGLMKCVQQIRGAGFVIHQPNPDVVGIGWPIVENGSMTAALGVYLLAHRFKDKHRQRVLAGMKETSAAVSAKLAGKGTGG